MKIFFPPRRQGDAGNLALNPGHCMIIVGANGAGKTRFTAATAMSLGDKAYPVSALNALYRNLGSAADIPPQLGAILAPVAAATLAGGRASTLLEVYLAQLLHDEMLSLLSYKLAVADHRKASPEKTKLDTVIEIWQDVFPGNRVLVDSGDILFARGLDPAAYSSLRLSDGERAVLYYTAAVLYAPAESVIFVGSPEIFLHPTLMTSLWNRLELLRGDCSFCYTTHDTEFVSTRDNATLVWVRDCDAVAEEWDYDILPPGTGVSNELYMTLAGARKPVLFIEGNSERSIDAKLYPLIFPDFSVRSLGSCNKVIEATRTFNDLSAMHKLDSFGIVDRDRRDAQEVDYLRRKKIMVPEVAEIENLLIVEDVVREMAVATGHDPDHVFARVRKAVISMFKAEITAQALMHTRHRVKRTVEYRVDARFPNINKLEEHLEGLLDQINPRKFYEQFCREFHAYVNSNNYAAILRVYNQKSMLSGCNVAQMCGYNNKDQYIRGVLDRLKKSPALRAAMRRQFTLPE